MTMHTCAISGEASGGKHYVLKTTEGEELVCPEALFHSVADREMGRIIVHMTRRIQLLEAALERAGISLEPEADDRVGEAAQQAAAPVKKAAAKKATAPQQRKAAD